MLGYTSRRQLFVYSCFTCLLSALLFMLLLFSCLFSMLISYLMTVVYLVIILCTLFICTSFPFTHTLTRSLSDDPGFVRPDMDALFLLFRCSLRPYASRRVRASPYSISVFLSFLSSYYFLILVILDSFVIPILDSMISCVDAYM